MKAPHYDTAYHWNKAIQSVGEPVVYLDVDGVVLDKETFEPAKCLHEFIEFITSKYTCFWLTQHIDIDVPGTRDHLWSYLYRNGVEEKTLKLMEGILMTRWKSKKTEGIISKSNFTWFDSSPTEKEIDDLKKINMERSLYKVNNCNDLCKWLLDNKIN